MTAAERLVALAGHGGTAAALLLSIGTGATAGAALVDYSQQAGITAAAHLLAQAAAPATWSPRHSGGWGAPGVLAPIHQRHDTEDDALMLLL